MPVSLSFLANIVRLDQHADHLCFQGKYDMQNVQNLKDFGSHTLHTASL